MAAHAPAYVHATVYLRQNDSEPPSSLQLWQALFHRWEEIFSLAPASSSLDAATGHGGDGRSPTTLSASSSSAFAGASTMPQQVLDIAAPPPGCMILRLLLCSGSVLPGTLPLSSPQYTQDRAFGSAATHEVLNDIRLRNDDAVAACAYAEWWQWVLGDGTGAAASAATKFLFAAAVKIGCLLQFVSVAGLQGVTRCVRVDTHTVARAQSALFAAATQLAPETPLPAPFLLAHLPGLCGATGEAFMDVLPSSANANANANANSTTTGTSGGGGGTGEVDFFSFTVLRAVRPAATATASSMRDIGLELAFLDEQDDAPSLMSRQTTALMKVQQQQQHAGARVRGRNAPPDRDAKLLTAPRVGADDDDAAATRTVASATTLWSPRWHYGCARFVALPSRATPGSGIGGAVATAILREPTAGVLRAPVYEEPFGIRFVLLLGQRLLGGVGGGARGSAQGAAAAAELASAGPPHSSLLRLAGRLAFWAATAAASFPMELPAARSSFRHRGGGGGGAFLEAATGGLDGVGELVCIPCMATCLALHCSLALATSGGGGVHDFAASDSAAAVDTTSACEALLSVALAYAACSYAAAASGAGGVAVSHGGGGAMGEREPPRVREHGALTLRHLVLSAAASWVQSYPVALFRRQVPRHVVASLPAALRGVVELRLAGNQPQVRAAPVRVMSFTKTAADSAAAARGGIGGARVADDPDALSLDLMTEEEREAVTKTQLLRLWAQLEAAAFEPC